MGSNAPTPLATTTIKTTEDAIKFFRLLRAGCRLRGIEWWLNDALEEFPSVNARATAIRALDKAIRIDQLMEQNLDTALAPQGGIRLDMNTADETPTPAQENAPRAPTTTPSTGNFKSSLLPHGTYGLQTIEIWAQTTVTAALGEGSAILDTASLAERPGTASLRVVKNILAPRTTQAASAARTALDTIINSFVKDCGASLLVVWVSLGHGCSVCFDTGSSHVCRAQSGHSPKPSPGAMPISASLSAQRLLTSAAATSAHVKPCLPKKWCRTGDQKSGVNTT